MEPFEAPGVRGWAGTEPAAVLGCQEGSGGVRAVQCRVAPAPEPSQGMWEHSHPGFAPHLSVSPSTCHPLAGRSPCSTEPPAFIFAQGSCLLSPHSPSPLHQPGAAVAFSVLLRNSGLRPRPPPLVQPCSCFGSLPPALPGLSP